MTHEIATFRLRDVPAPQTPANDDQGADVRLEVIRTQAVGIVDRAANGETFLTLKSMDGQQEPPTAAPPAEAQKAPDMAPPAAPAPAASQEPLKLPGAQKTALVAALGPLLGHLTDAAELVAGAAVDDAAPPMPAALLEHLVAVDDGLDEALAPYDPDLEQMAATPGPTPPPGGDAAQKAAPAEGAAPAAADGAADAKPKRPKPRLALKRIADMDGVAKALADNAQKVGDMVAWAKGATGCPAPGMAPAAKADLDPFTALFATVGAARDRLYAVCDKLRMATDPAGIAAANEEIAQVMAMLDNAKGLGQPGGAPVQVAPAQPPPAAASDTPAQKAAQPVDIAEIVKALKTELLPALKAELEPALLETKAVAARAQQTATAALDGAGRALKSIVPPQAAPPEGGPPPPPPRELSFAEKLEEAKKARDVKRS